MRFSIRTAVVLALVFAGVLAAAENPFAGTWKFNPAKSKITGDTMKFENTAAGAIRWSGSGLSYTFKVDGKPYTGPMGETMVWKQLDDHTWETTTTRKDTLLSTDTAKLSPDDKTMTVVSRGTKPNGDKFEDTTVYQRTSGENGLVGEWKDTKVEVSSPGTIEITPSGQDGILFKSLGYKSTCDAQFDGKDYPVTGPTVPEGVTVSLKHNGPRSFKARMKKSGKLLFWETYVVSPDGHTLTVVGSAIAVNEPYTEVFDRQ